MISPLLTYWMELRGAADMPAYAQFDPTSLPGILPDLLVMRVHAAPLDFEYSLIGSNIRRIHRENRRGQRMSTIDGQGKGSQLWDFLETVAARREPASFDTPYAGPVEEIERVQSHATPWAGADGRISRLVIHVPKDHFSQALPWTSPFGDAL